MQRLCAVSDATARNAALPCVRLAFALWHLPEDQGQALLRLALQNAETVLVADFKLAERNLELPAVLAAQGLMALTGVLGGVLGGVLARVLGGIHGRTHAALRASRAGQSNFMQTGGIEGLVHRSGALVHERRPIFAGAAALLRLQHP
ncbi:hypothetical protein DDIC_10085 [Desulfovibrio desulfuricans]|uniref:Uncharacterized protein n=1 Tax=Desulfovibrio desulfuricans TaxID=876 RepID=A0A4P7UN50_DESDE|nr:hypothetical protein DDIC_10085 [Desulfovibrio desulfuricans]